MTVEPETPIVPEMASEPADEAETMDVAIERVEGASVYDLARRMQLAVRDFAEAYAQLMSERDVPDTYMDIQIRGRSDGELKITFCSSVYHSASGDFIRTPMGGDPVQIVDEFLQRWDRNKAIAVPMITHRR